MRLNRYLAQAGLGSRRSCEALILEGRVQLNGRKVEVLATTVESGDRVEVDGKAVGVNAFKYYLMNKPRGFHCTAADPSGRRTVYDLLPDGLPRLFYVGRLDAESEGLLIMTNDGALAQHLTHPSRHVEKEYEVLLDQPLEPHHVEKLLKGTRLEEGFARVHRISDVAGRRVRVVLQQGMKRQIRRMFFGLGYEVERLRRIRIGGVRMAKLPLGACRPLSQAELHLLTSGAQKSDAETALTGSVKPTGKRRPSRRGR